MQNKKADRETILKLLCTIVTQHPTIPQHCLFLQTTDLELLEGNQNTVADVSFPIHHQSLRSDSFSHCACCWIFVLTPFDFSHYISCFMAKLFVIQISFCHRYKFSTQLSVAVTARDTAVALMFITWYCARHCRLALMFIIWYCAGHCSGSYVHYPVLRETLQWLLCSLSGTARDTAVALMFIIWYCAGHCSGSHVQFTNMCTVQLPHCRTKVLYLLYSSICCRR